MRTLKVLVVDDEITNCMLLHAMLAGEGHTVATAHDGVEAIRLFTRERPDLILMDINMPSMDGYEATRQIKEIAGENFVPVIFVTAMDDDLGLARCIECGGDDFITKPYNRIILTAKIAAMARLGQLYATIRVQRDELAYHQERLITEQEVAKNVFSNIVHAGAINAPNIKYLISPMAIFNGDMLLVARRPAGGLYVMLGDFTGHGLSAAIGAMPVADIFYRMSAKGFSIHEIVSEINQKLRVVLPTGIFLAACLIELDIRERKLSVWNGGVPDLLVFRPGVGIRHRAVSRHVPLGVLSNNKLGKEMEILDIEENDRVLLYTDGLIEAWNGRGEMFGQDRLDIHLQPQSNASSIFENICTSLQEFVGAQSPTDDMTFIEVACDPAAMEYDVASRSSGGVATQAMNWRFTLELSADSLRALDPMPLLIHVLMEIQGLRTHRERLYMVLTELYSNALEHGLLGLDSHVKSTPQGYGEYYNQRQQALAHLQEGRLHIELHHDPIENGGRLVMRIEDSGIGFNHTQKLRTLENNITHSGRGIALVRSLCRDLIYEGHGNIARAIYEWKH